MKEIDFIPEWYKANRKRRQRYIRQYTLIGTLFALMVIWSFIVGGHIRTVRAEVTEIETAMQKGKQWVEEAATLEQDVALMRMKTTLLEDITPRTAVSAIIGELSYLIQKDIVLTELSMVNEPIQKEQPTDVVTTAAVVQVGTQSDASGKPSVIGRPSRVRVLLSGIAAAQSDAAGLIARLENSDYFDEVSLVFSRPKKLKENTVTEFKIRCYVADYRVIQ